MFALAHAEVPVVSPSPAMTVALPSTTYEITAELPLQVFAASVDVAVSRTGRRYRLSVVESQELRSDLWLHWLQDRRGLRDRLAVLEHPERYLTRVARNMVLDGYIARHGKRRPSAAARRAANAADEPPCDVSKTVQEPRAVRRYLGESVLLRLECRAPSPFDLRRRSVASSDARRLRLALHQILTCLPQDERELLVERYAGRRSVADIAAGRNVQAKRLYREYQSILGNIRRQLRDAGFDRARVREVLEQRGLDSAFGAP